MDGFHAYDSAFDEDRRVIQEANNAQNKPMDQDAEKAHAERCGRRAERKVCRCGNKPRSRTTSRTRRRRRIVSQNPFIIFYLEMYYKSPGKRVTEVARQAGKEWCAMSPEDRTKYIRLAERERRRRGRRGKRRRGC